MSWGGGATEKGSRVAERRTRWSGCGSKRQRQEHGRHGSILSDVASHGRREGLSACIAPHLSSKSTQEATHWRSLANQVDSCGWPAGWLAGSFPSALTSLLPLLGRCSTAPVPRAAMMDIRRPWTWHPQGCARRWTRQFHLSAVQDQALTCNQTVLEPQYLARTSCALGCSRGGKAGDGGRGREGTGGEGRGREGVRDG